MTDTDAAQAEAPGTLRFVMQFRDGWSIGCRSVAVIACAVAFESRCRVVWLICALIRALTCMYVSDDCRCCCRGAVRIGLGLMMPWFSR